MSAARPLGSWEAAPAPPGEIAAPANLAYAALRWVAAPVPGTAAQALRQAGLWDLDHERDFDADDWWYRCTFRHRSTDASARYRLRFDGLATLADVWLNGHLILTSDNMFHAHEVDVTETLSEANEFVICFRSLRAALPTRRPRPRWKTRLVDHQQWRWFRTTLLGRMPGWSPPVAAVGPWRGIALERVEPASLADVAIRATLDGRTSVLDFSGRLAVGAKTLVTGALSIDGRVYDLDVDRQDDSALLSAQLRLDDVEPWWPHTHGRPALYRVVAEIQAGDQTIGHDCGAVGFRRIELRQEAGAFSLVVNDVPIFCRGGCWTSGDIVSLDAAPETIAGDLAHMQQAGANMIRVGGTMVYESDAFYRLCDELGLLVWQDFMFANMDYPAGDPQFRESVAIEAAQQLRRLCAHPCIAVYCGNSEVEQQAAMVGTPKEIWRHDLFATLLPDLCARLHPGAPYVASTPSGGTLPFHTGTGVTHYYGVGAYRRPVEDARRANVRFTPECLAFSNVPEPGLVDEVMQGRPAAPHDPRWKRGVPRDTGAPWDFEDVRDHYLTDLFGADAGRLRLTDAARYLALGRVTTGEVMSRVFAEWRGASATCQGGLVWFVKDLWPGAGWGVLDNRGDPKACFYYLKRAWQPRALLVTDEGLNGLHLHAVNDSDRALRGSVEVTLLGDGHVVVGRGRVTCDVGPRSRATIEADAVLGGFSDVTYAYRFGPPTHDVVAATLIGERGEIVSEAFWFPAHVAVARPRPCAVVAEARAIGESAYALSLTSDRFLLAARVEAPGYMPDDNYFCLMPGRTRVIRLDARADAPGVLRGAVEALNLDRAVPIEKAARGLVAS